MHRMTTDLVVSTYNVHSCVGTDGRYSVDRVARVIRELGSHVVCLQEVESNTPPDGAANPHRPPTRNRVWSEPHVDDQSSAIASLAGYDHHVFAPAIRSRATSRCRETHDYASSDDVSGSFGDGRRKGGGRASGFEERGANDMGRFGIAVLSKYPIVEVRTHQYQRYKRKTLRNAVACLISLPRDTMLWVVNTHLGCHFVGREQYRQAIELCAFVDSLESNPKICGVILCGDFNSPPMLPSMRFIRQRGLEDAWRLRAGRHSLFSGGTFPSSGRIFGAPCCARIRKLMRLDYIFVKEDEGQVVCKCVYVHDDGSDCAMASDHLPLCAAFAIGF